MRSRYFVIPVAQDGTLPDDLKICETRIGAFEAAMEAADRHVGL